MSLSWGKHSGGHSQGSNANRIRCEKEAQEVPRAELNWRPAWGGGGMNCHASHSRAETGTVPPCMAVDRPSHCTAQL